MYPTDSTDIPRRDIAKLGSYRVAFNLDRAPGQLAGLRVVERVAPDTDKDPSFAL